MEERQLLSDLSEVRFEAHVGAGQLDDEDGSQRHTHVLRDGWWTVECLRG